METYYTDLNHCVNLDIDSSILRRLIKQLCKNISISDEDDNLLYNTVEVDVAIVIGKKPIICNPLSESNPSGQLPSTMPNKKNKEGAKRQYTFDILKIDIMLYL